MYIIIMFQIHFFFHVTFFLGPFRIVFLFLHVINDKIRLHLLFCGKIICSKTADNYCKQCVILFLITVLNQNWN